MSAPSEHTVHGLLQQGIEQHRQKFLTEKSLLSFQEYLDIVAETPQVQLRDAARYIRDCFDHYGTQTLHRPYGQLLRYRLFDAPFDAGQSAVYGQEAVQQHIYGQLTDFVRQGRVSKLILLHGPNGSAKSSLIRCIFSALEHYSHTPTGALYTFNWVFPTKQLGRSNIGFSGAHTAQELDSYAHLPESGVDARLRTETRDHPLLLLPRDLRLSLLRTWLGPDHPLPSNLSEGELSPKARQIFDALLRAYQGDLSEVLKHVQVERFYISRRYRSAAATVDPQMHVDAAVKQITGDRSLSALPPSLQNLNLFEAMGDLVQANRGLLEFNDLLKRPIEAFKYILSTCEHGTVRLNEMTLHLDTVFIGSCNEVLLEAFTKHPDFESFKARIELIKVPYLVDYLAEERVYTPFLQSAAITKAIAPHTATLAALWATLTRLSPPMMDGLSRELQKQLNELSPIEKAQLYAQGEIPPDFSQEQSAELKMRLVDLYHEQRSGTHYEGRYGASPREIKATLLAAARMPRYNTLSAFALLEQLQQLCEQEHIYKFLQREPKGLYYHPIKALSAVRDWYLERVEEELNAAMGLVATDAAHDLLSRYVDQVMYFVRKEKWYNPITGNHEDPDERLMREVEKYFNVKEREVENFRASTLHRIAAWKMDHPEAQLDLASLFKSQIAHLNECFYDERRVQGTKLMTAMRDHLLTHHTALDTELRERAQQSIQQLKEKYGYTDETLLEVLSAVLKMRNTHPS